MKYVKDDRELTSEAEFVGIPEEYIKGLRLREQPTEVNRGIDDNHGNTLRDYVNNLIRFVKKGFSIMVIGFGMGSNSGIRMLRDGDVVNAIVTPYTNEYKDKIPEELYDALLNYEVRIENDKNYVA